MVRVWGMLSQILWKLWALKLCYEPLKSNSILKGLLSEEIMKFVYFCISLVTIFESRDGSL